MEQPRKAGSTLVDRCAKQHSEPASDRRGPRADEPTLTPIELIERVAALVPPPSTHRHRNFGVLALNSPFRAAVTTMAQEAPSQPVKVPAEPTTEGYGVPGFTPGNSVPTQLEPAPPKSSAAHYLWAVLIARIYEVFPLLCPMCGGQMRIFGFITHSADRRQMLYHTGVPAEPPCISPARGPPLWENCDAQARNAAQIEQDWAPEAQSAPIYEDDQRVNR
jgi:Putative transposase